MVEPILFDRISVPRPSFSLTAELEKTIDATPTFFALKMIEIIWPLLPQKPGFGTPPLNVTWPMLFEKLGFSTHKEKMDDLLSKETTSNKSLGKLTILSALFINLPEVSTEI